MNAKAIVQLVMVSLLGTSGTVFAQPPRSDHAGGQPSHESRQPSHGTPYRAAHQSTPREASSGGPGGPIPHSDWHKGERLPAEYRDRNYVVDDWHGHGLQAPPRGYQWLGVNGDYVLAAIATGVIANVLLSGR
jgi:Ni/Co efflux regulator RcnB